MRMSVVTVFILMFSVMGVSAIQADNSAKNKRDQQAHEITADKHGTSEKDIKISSTLRQALVNDSALSTYAQNVKIITVNGEVILKGPVKTVQEQNALVSAAKKVSGVTNVVNKTEVVTE
jgi:hyperosmotically inducible periplasmic protein